MKTWVLGGGGARGASQAGVILGLFEAGIKPPDSVIGVSVGALNGATIARFPSLAGAQMLREMWRSSLVPSVFRPRPLESLLNRLRGRQQLSLLSATALHRLVRRQLQLLGIERFDELELPLQVGVTDLGEGDSRLISDGPLAPALAASTAIPGLFPGVGIGSDVFFDGGVADNDPIDRAVEGGATEVLAISLCGVSGGISRPERWLDLLGESVAIMLHTRMLAHFRRLRDCARIIVVCPYLPPSSAWNLEAEHVGDIVDQTKAATLRWLEERGGALPEQSEVVQLELDSSGPRKR